MSSNHADYNASQIQVLEGLEAVRRRPGMYIGSTDVRGLHHLVKELVDNSIDEALAGYCTHIEITIHKDNSLTETDNGRGIPVDYHEKMKKSALEVALTVLHAGGKFGGSGYKVSGGLHGVGLSVVNALSKWLNVEVRRDGIIYKQEYELGKPKTDVQKIGTYNQQENSSGTSITFLADDEVFDSVEYDFNTMASRMRELAFLNKGVSITVIDERCEPINKKIFCYEGGINSFVQHLNKNKEVINEEPIYFFGEKNDPEKDEVATVEVSMQYNTDYHESIFTFANNINTIEGGSHLVGFKAALTRVVKDYARKYKLI
ncbi:MAG: DNA topoisomerase IV subunit B, partial [Oscillospiraceae bacterium]|nr:DNA topoisomerase IV subunit B [Oscillospiraceae bacterium]